MLLRTTSNATITIRHKWKQLSKICMCTYSVKSALWRDIYVIPISTTAHIMFFMDKLCNIYMTIIIIIPLKPKMCNIHLPESYTHLAHIVSIMSSHFQFSVLLYSFSFATWASVRWPLTHTAVVSVIPQVWITKCMCMNRSDIIRAWFGFLRFQIIHSKSVTL